LPAAGQQPVILAARYGAADERSLARMVHARKVVRTRSQSAGMVWSSIPALDQPQFSR
jgi:hypothetical protein